MEDELLTIEQVAERLQLHPDTIRRYVREKKLKAIQLSKTNLRVRRSELNRFLKERETNGGTDKPI
jgi:excisionase family DNA binding protein